MDEELAHVLLATQDSNESIRKQAEAQIHSLYTNPSFGLALVQLAASDRFPINIRQSAILVCKKFVELGWSPSLDNFGGQILVKDEDKSTIRRILFDLAISNSDERKIKNAASLVVGKIATADFPEEWPDLLTILLSAIPTASDGQLHGALRLLQDLIDDCLNEQQFFSVEKDLLSALYTVAVDENRKTTLRALAISAFRSCFSHLEMIMEDHKVAVKSFAEHTLQTWMPFFISVLTTKLPPLPFDNAEAHDPQSDAHYRGCVALKLQIVLVLVKVKSLFPAVLTPQATTLFSTIWDQLTQSKVQYCESYIENNRQGRLEDADGLPYTLDFLVQDELDFMQSCLKAPPVRKELERQLKSPDTSDWVGKVVELLITYSQITTEEEGMWEVDINLFLTEESSITANYTARCACAQFIIVLGEWLQNAVIDALIKQIQSQQDNEKIGWKFKEATLFILNSLLTELYEPSHTLPSNQAHAILSSLSPSLQAEDALYRARVHLTTASLIRCCKDSLQDSSTTYLQSCLNTMTTDESDIVKMSCVKAVQSYLNAIEPNQSAPLQSHLINQLSQFFTSLGLTDFNESEDITVTFLETLRDVIIIDTRICLHSDALDLLFNLAHFGASSFQIAMLITETFEEMTSTISATGKNDFEQLTSKVLPPLLEAMDRDHQENVDSHDAEHEPTNLIYLVADLLEVFLLNSPSPLPSGVVANVMPRLQYVLLNHKEDALLKACTSSVKAMLEHDPQQVLSYNDPATGQTSLEILLHIVSRLLSPEINDDAGSEVGGLAVALVEKAGAEALGPYLEQLLQAVAVRLVNAEKVQIIQSLILVFARLAISSASEVVQFLAGIRIDASAIEGESKEEQSGLEIVIKKWLERSVEFVGFEEIRQNDIALTKIYDLHSPLISSIIVKGDLIPPTNPTSRIITRSRAKQMPIQYTSVPADVKIIKVLINELLYATSSSSDFPPGVADDDVNTTYAEPRSAISSANRSRYFPQKGRNDQDESDEDEDEGWEDDDNGTNGVLDLASGLTKESLMAFGSSGPNRAMGRGAGGGFSGFGNAGKDQEGEEAVVRELMGWFRGVIDGQSAGKGDFEKVYGYLNDEEKGRLRGWLAV